MAKTNTVTWVQYKKYSGCRVIGNTEVPLPKTNLHIERAYWLTAMMESPKYGSVQSYDGAAMSGGPLHCVAVYPRGLKQGELFSLIHQIERGVPALEPLLDLYVQYKLEQWFVARDGKLRRWTTGEEIPGREIQNKFTPPNGQVPRRGVQWETAKSWALLHHNLFSHPDTFNIQKEYAIDYLLRTQKSYEAEFYKDANINTLRVLDRSAFRLYSSHEDCNNYLTLQEDLAMCMYHAHSVNGPAPARSVLQSVLKQTQREPEFAKLLIWSLGRKKYGKWEDTTDGRNRYDRTRYHASKSGLWPASFFVGKDAIMPKDLPAKYS